ncbi:MAG: ribosylnicotinamide kinase [Segetibacter sp.]|jgi:NadR type nicotinamide-nucleotide adenylyltransferase|nr:ribosylnicotinamide kinase [Segetibacter sp.]
MQQVKKIVIIGPESTGKSTLCELLAKHYDATWCGEFAREYLITHGTNYTYDDLLVIAKGQLALEDEYVNKVIEKWQLNKNKNHHPLLFVDTDMYVMKVWCEYVFGKCHQFILDKIVESTCDLYLLCNIDLPWVKDELREYPDLKSREELYHIYKDILINQQVRWVNISGSNEERLKAAVTAIDTIIFS